MKRKSAPWGTSEKVTETDLKQVIAETADHFVKEFGLENAFMFSWAVTEELERRLEDSGERVPMPKGEKTQKLLADFAVARLMHEHHKLHDIAMRYQTRVLAELELEETEK